MKECKHCLRQYEPANPKSLFCSDTCRQSNSKGYKSDMRDLNQALKDAGLPTTLSASASEVKFIPTGIPEIDAMTGGFPRYRITEIYGPKAVGKTTLMTRLFNADAKIFYVDTENAVKSPPSNVEQFSEYILEQVQDAVEKALESGKYDIIVVDSVASMVPRAEVEGDPGDSHMGLKARLMSQWMRRINTSMSKSRKTAVVFINQQRASMNPYGPMKFTPGGFGLPYAASLRLELKSNKVDKYEGGQWVHVEVEKSRVCKPYQKTKFKLGYA